MYASQLQTDCATARASPRLSEYATTAKKFLCLWTCYFGGNSIQTGLREPQFLDEERFGCIADNDRFNEAETIYQ